MSPCFPVRSIDAAAVCDKEPVGARHEHVGSVEAAEQRAAVRRAIRRPRHTRRDHINVGHSAKVNHIKGP